MFDAAPLGKPSSVPLDSATPSHCFVCFPVPPPGLLVLCCGTRLGHLCIGGRLRTAEMPLVWELMMADVLSPWSEDGGMRSLASPSHHSGQRGGRGPLWGRTCRSHAHARYQVEQTLCLTRARCLKPTGVWWMASVQPAGGSARRLQTTSSSGFIAQHAMTAVLLFGRLQLRATTNCAGATRAECSARSGARNVTKLGKLYEHERTNYTHTHTHGTWAEDFFWAETP